MSGARLRRVDVWQRSSQGKLWSVPSAIPGAKGRRFAERVAKARRFILSGHDPKALVATPIIAEHVERLVDQGYRRSSVATTPIRKDRYTKSFGSYMVDRQLVEWDFGSGQGRVTTQRLWNPHAVKKLSREVRELSRRVIQLERRWESSGMDPRNTAGLIKGLWSLVQLEKRHGRLLSAIRHPSVSGRFVYDLSCDGQLDGGRPMARSRQLQALLELVAAADEAWRLVPDDGAPKGARPDTPMRSEMTVRLYREARQRDPYGSHASRCEWVAKKMVGQGISITGKRLQAVLRHLSRKKLR